MTFPFVVPDPGRAKALAAFFGLVRSGDAAAVSAALDDDESLLHDYDPDPWCCRATPLNVAVSRGVVAVVELLLDRGADPNQKSAWWAGGFGPLDSVSPARPDIVDLLLARGAVLDVHAAAALGRIEDLVRLLDHDPFRVNAPGGDGGRPLHFARTPEVVGILLERGALLDPLDVDHGSTPAQWAVKDRPEVTRTLLDRGARADVFMLASLGDPGPLSRWLDASPGDASRVLSPEDFAVMGSEGQHIYAYVLPGFGSTPLHCAARSGVVGAVDLLMSAGADVMARGGYDQQTPLHVAASADQPEVVARLVDRGADVDARSGPEHHTPPIVWALVFGARRAVDGLIAAGATVDAAVVESARAGVDGAFDSYSSAGPGDFAAMLAAVEAAAETGA